MFRTTKTEMSRLLPPLRTLLPPEHGSWFMLGFPLVLGLLLKPDWAALCLGLGALACFLARPPLRRVLGGRAEAAQWRALLLAVGLGLGFGASALLLSGPRFLLPLGCVTPLILLALWADQQRAVRSLLVEVAVQGAFAGLAAAMLVAGGGTLLGAGRAWLLVTLVGGANLAHVRRLLGHARGLGASELRHRLLAVHALHALLSGASALLLAPRGRAGIIWTVWTALLYLRALLPYRPLPARSLGWREGGLSVVGLLFLWRALR
jgi:hypothetical protein